MGQLSTTEQPQPHSLPGPAQPPGRPQGTRAANPAFAGLQRVQAKPTRLEHDSFGAIPVDADRLWGAQTQRSLQNFKISTERMPAELIHALAAVKRACAVANGELGRLAPDHAQAIIDAADEVLQGLHPDEFPLSVWQTGSGTQTNMNMNEVLANRGSELLEGERGAARLLHANDHVNHGQSSNDIIPTAMHVAAADGIRSKLLPALSALRATLDQKAMQFDQIVKIGRTHLQDATPLTLGQEFSGYAAQLQQAEKRMKAAVEPLLELAVGGTAVGTGLNTHPQFGQRVAAELAQQYDLRFRSADNKFAAIATHDAMVGAHGDMAALAVSTIKIVNDIRMLASGPRSGIGEIRLPENEPGSSIMPGKVNPTQCEATSMFCTQVLGNQTTINFAGASGAFELNAYKPLIAHNFLQSVRLLSDGITSFDKNCAKGIEANEARIEELMGNSLMLVTALTDDIGYDDAAKVAKKAHRDGSTLKQAASALNLVSEDRFDELVQPMKMTQPG